MSQRSYAPDRTAIVLQPPFILMTVAERLNDIRWLLSPAAEPWLARAAEADEPASVRLIAELRRDLSPDQVHLVVEQVALRRRGARKFSAAARMFFTPFGLEQATDEWVAHYKAARFVARGEVADLCCGIGGDLFALAARGPAVGVDRDPIAALLAEANCRVQPAANGVATKVSVTDVEHYDVASFAGWHIDPDRRPRGRRTTRVELHEPGPAVIDRLRAANPCGAIKLSPAATLPDAWPREAELEWISRDGECRQLVVWFAGLARELGRHRATIVDAAGSMVRTLVGPCDAKLPATRAPGAYLYEPDAAVLAAGLASTLAQEHALGAITPGIAYLTGDTHVNDAALACFRVEETLPLDVRRLREVLQARGIGRLEIKMRGVQCEPEKLRRELKPTGDNEATLILAPLAGRPTVFLAQRVRQVAID